MSHLIRRFQTIFAVSGALMIAACGGGGGGEDTDAGTPVTKLQSGTYTLTSGGDVKGSFMLDKDGAITICALGTDPSCTAEITPPAGSGGNNGLTLQANTSAAKVNGTIAANGSISAQLTSADGAVTPLAGSKVSDNYVDCSAPFTRKDGQCQPPASASIVISPRIVWQEELPPGGGRIYTMLMCYADLNNCVEVSPPIRVSAQDLADGETPEIIAYARSVAVEFQNIIARLLAGKTYPKQSVLVKIFRDAVQGAINSGSGNAVESAVSALQAAGFSAAAPGGQSGSPSGTAPTAASGCAEQAYLGKDISEPQVYLQDKYAQFLSCIARVTNDNQQVVNGNKVCKTLDGLLKATNSSFKPVACIGTQLKQNL